jgi:aspartyl protease family protein
MIRLLVPISLLLAAAVAVPMLYESNPELFRWRTGSAPEPALVANAQAPGKTQPEALGGRKVRLTSDQRGHYAGTFKLNGRVVEGMVDTGATVVAINESTARRIGIVLKLADFIHEVQTANGKTRAAAAVIGDMQIGKVVVKDVPAAVLDDRALQTTLVGMSFLGKLTRFHVDNGGMVLEQ